MLYISQLGCTVGGVRAKLLVRTAYFQFIPGYELTQSVRTPSGIVYLGHLCTGESGQFRPLIFLGPVRSGVVRCGVSSDRRQWRDM